MFERLKKFLDINNDRCFAEHKNEDGVCYGVFGGDRNTDFLSETCIDCKHHTMLLKTYHKENENG